MLIEEKGFCQNFSPFQIEFSKTLLGVLKNISIYDDVICVHQDIV